MMEFTQFILDFYDADDPQTKTRLCDPIESTSPIPFPDRGDTVKLDGGDQTVVDREFLYAHPYVYVFLYCRNMF